MARKNSLHIRGIVVLLVGIFIASVFLYKIQRIVSQSRFFRNDRVAVAVHTNPALVLIFEPDTQVHAIQVPLDALVAVPRGYGDYQLSAVWNLGKLDGVSGELFSETLSQLTTVPIDHFLRMPDESVVSRLQSFTFVFFPKNVETNLSFVDRFIIHSRLSGLDNESLEKFDIGQTGAVSQSTRPDGSQVLQIDFARLDILLADVVQDGRIRSENATVAVLNAADRSFLGKNVARMVTGMGGHVVRIDNTLTQENCLIRTTTAYEKSITAYELAHVFLCTIAPDILETDAREDIQLIVGTVAAEQMLGKNQ